MFTPGQSGFIAPNGTKSPHYADQLGLYWQFKHKPLPYSEVEVRAMKEAEVVLQIDRGD